MTLNELPQCLLIFINIKHYLANQIELYKISLGKQKYMICLGLKIKYTICVSLCYLLRCS